MNINLYYCEQGTRNKKLEKEEAEDETPILGNINFLAAVSLSHALCLYIREKCRILWRMYDRSSCVEKKLVHAHITILVDLCLHAFKVIRHFDRMIFGHSLFVKLCEKERGL